MQWLLDAGIDSTLFTVLVHVSIAGRATVKLGRLAYLAPDLLSMARPSIITLLLGLINEVSGTR